MALGLLRLIVGVGVGAAMSQRRRGRAPQQPGYPPAQLGPRPLVAPLAPIPPVSAPSTLAALPPPRQSVSNASALTAGLFGTFAVAIGALMMALQAMMSSVDVSEERWWHLGAGLVGNALVCVLPGVLLYVVTGWLVWRNRRLARVQTLCDTHARLPIATLAQHLNTSEEMAQAIALDAVERGLIQARLDLEPGVILSGNAVTNAGRQWAGTCPRCSAPVSVVLAPGQPAICPFCRGALGVTG